MNGQVSFLRIAGEVGRFAAGAFLVCSGLLKYLFPDYLSTEFFSVSNPSWYQVLYLFEIVLGVLLLLRAANGVEAYIGILTYGGFVLLQSKYVVTGEKACSCLGALSVDPRVMLAIDAVILLLLIVHVVQERPRFRPRWLRLACAVVLLATGYALVERVSTDGKAGALAALRGQTVYVQSPFIDLGEVEAETKVSVQVPVRNRGQQPARIVGVSTSPIVSLGQGLPVTIDGKGGTAEVAFALIARGEAGRHSKRISIFIADRDQLTAIPVVVAWVIP